MDASQGTLCFEQPENFLKNETSLLVSPRNTGFCIHKIWNFSINFFFTYI